MSELWRRAVDRDRAWIADAVFISVWGDAGDCLPLARGQSESHLGAAGLEPRIDRHGPRARRTGKSQEGFCSALAAVGKPIGATRQSAVDRSKFRMGEPLTSPASSLRRGSSLIILPTASIMFSSGCCLAIFDHLVLDFPALLEVGEVLVGEAVVPTAVPGGERVGVFLVGVGELAAGEAWLHR